ncbi:MAG: sulfotransferase [Candidatus Caenarcaniphilales bacterium]|nr:sulfotransferase [Candidatus Caenarcaniphilales bacterium]
MKEPIFIVGEGRSGTTTLRNIISEHPNIWGVDRESYLFVENWPQANPFFKEYENNFQKLLLSVFVSIKRVGVNAHKIIKSKDLPEDIKEELDQFKESVEYANLKKQFKETEEINRFEIFEAISNYYCKKFAKNRFIEKTPYHLYYVKEILQKYPNAKIIALYRDPRAVCASWLKLDNLKNLLGVCLSWNKAMREIRELKKQLNENQLKIIRFEDLISSPEETLKDICNFIGEDFKPNLLEVGNKSNSSYESDRAETGFRTNTLNRWQKILTTKQVALINLICSKFYSDFNIENYSNKLKPLEVLYMPLFISLEPIKLFTVKLKKLISRYV